MQRPTKIACIGEVMIELATGLNGQANIGVAGDTYNTAVYLRKISDDDTLDVSYVTALGEDSFSQKIISQIKHHGISADHIELREDLMPGLYAIETDEDGERTFSYWRGQSAAKTLFQEPCKIRLDSISDFDLIYISGISMAILPNETRVQLIDSFKEFRNKGGKLAFDSNYRPRLWEDVETARSVTMTMWSLADIALPSLDDEMALFGETSEAQTLQRLADSGVASGALKRGIEGPLALGESTGDMTFERVTNVVDTTAAGDSFNAGYLAAHMAGQSGREAMLKGHALASKVIQERGAIIDLDKVS